MEETKKQWKLWDNKSENLENNEEGNMNNRVNRH